MNGDPVDPISFELALQELWDRLAANAGLSLKAFLRQPYDWSEQSAEEREAYEQRGDHLHSIRMDALDRLLQLVITEKIGVWRSDSEDWKRPTREWLKNRIFHKPEDEPWGIAVDRRELATAIAAHWQSEFSPERRLPEAASSGSRAGTKRGRPAGSGSYEKDDEPLLTDIQRLLDAGEAPSLHQASLMVAKLARGGGSLDSRAKRLRDRYSDRHRR